MASRVLVAVRVRVARERAFEAFTRELGAWWRPNGLFAFTRADTRSLRFEPMPNGRLLMTEAGGDEYEVGRIELWAPPAELAFSWRPRSFRPEQSTRVHVRFEPVGEETRVTVEHTGWDAIPGEHAARHGMDLRLFQQRLAEWWQELLAELSRTA
jgi:uncharacterized protein YndB with AHSA1/START domain